METLNLVPERRVEKVAELENILARCEMTTTQFAEYQGLIMFPDNIIGQTLIKKQVEGVLSPQEQDQLDELMNEDRALASDIDIFYKMFWEKDPHTTLVDMNDGVLISLDRVDSSKEKTIWTPGLSECFVVVVVVEDEKKQHIIMTHYPPANFKANSDKLKDLLLSAEVDTSLRKKAIVWAIEEYEQDRVTKLWSRKLLIEPLNKLVDALLAYKAQRLLLRLPVYDV